MRIWHFGILTFIHINPGILYCHEIVLGKVHPVARVMSGCPAGREEVARGAGMGQEITRRTADLSAEGQQEQLSVCQACIILTTPGVNRASAWREPSGKTPGLTDQSHHGSCFITGSSICPQQPGG